MTKSTEHLALYEAEKTDGTLTFNVQKMMNDNWDKLDADSKTKDTNITNIKNAIGSAVLSTTDKTVKGAINEVKKAIPTSLPANGGHASTADKFQTARNIALTGDVTGNVNFDGSANANIATSLKNSGVNAGTYRSVTVDVKGRVTAGTNPTTRDGYGLSDVPTKTEVDASIDDVQIGGVNLYKGTKDFKSPYWTIVGAGASIADSNQFPGFKAMNITADSNFVRSDTSSQGFDFSDTTKTWTISAYFWGNASNQKVGITVSINRVNWQQQTIPVGKYTKLSWTFTGDGSTLQGFRFETTGATSDANICIAKIKVEEGNKATTWSLAPEDDKAYIDAHIADTTKHIPYLGTTTNSGNVYSVDAPSGFTLTDGQPVRVKFNSASTDAISLKVGSNNAIPVYDFYGNAVTNVRQYGMVTLLYEKHGTTESFMLDGKGGDGTALPEQVLSGQTATTSKGKITGTMVNNPLNTVASDYVLESNNVHLYIPLGAYITPSGGHSDKSAVQISEPNLISANIKKGWSIFGVQGSNTVVDTADATAVANQIRSGQSAYIKGNKVTGTLPVQATGAQTITPGTKDIVKKAGIYDGDITVKAVSIITGSIILWKDENNKSYATQENSATKIFEKTYHGYDGQIDINFDFRKDASYSNYLPHVYIAVDGVMQGSWINGNNDTLYKSVKQTINVKNGSKIQIWGYIDYYVSGYPVLRVANVQMLAGNIPYID